MNLWLISGGALCLIWGVAHLFPTRSVVAGFGELSPDNHRILTMEWLAEGMTLMFLGLVVMLVSRDVAVEASARLVVRACAGMLVALAALSAATGAQTRILPMRICPWVKFTAACLLVAGSWG
jgi:hypothetical protein